MSLENVIGFLILWFVVGWFIKGVVEHQCGINVECAKNQAKWANILALVFILIGVYKGANYGFYGLLIALWLGIHHGVDAVEKKAEEYRIKEARKRREASGNDECSQLPHLESELKRVREEIQKHYYASKETGFNPIVDIGHQASAAKLLDRAEELEKKIQEIKRKYGC